MTGLFISFEGGEGAGKTTQAALLAERLRGSGRDVVAVREPGGTPVGEKIRTLVKGTGVKLSAATELLLFAAARAELVATIIRPSLDAGKVVIADRYADSTEAYQGYGRRLPLETVRAVNHAATGGLMPAITFLLDQPAEAGLARVGHPQLQLEAADMMGLPKRMDEEGQSKFEFERIVFHRRLRSGFLRLAKEEPNRVLVIDAARPREEIAQAVWTRVEAWLGARRRG